MAITMSVWESVEDLQQFVNKGGRVGSLRDRKQWFEPLEGAILALWWIPAGHIPTVAEARDRLLMLETRGPSPDAFTFRTPFPAPGADAPGEDAPGAAAKAIEGLDAPFCEW